MPTQQRDALRFYAELAATKDPELAFPTPTEVPRISSRPANPVAEWMANGHVHNIRFNSSFGAINPAMRDRGASYERNNVVHAQHWRHEDGPHPTLCVIHGFMGSAYMFNGLFFSLPWFYRSGYDIMLYTLPFHGRRAEKFSPYSGYGLFANGFAGFAEAMAQAVYDFRSLMDYLEFTGVDRIALTGMSLGGYTSALIACADDRIQAVIPNVPVVMPEKLVDEWWPANMLVALGDKFSDTSDELQAAAAMFHSPLNYPALVAKGPQADHRGSWRSACTAAAGGGAVGALGPLRVPLVPRQPHPARQPAGLPAKDDALHARLHVQLGEPLRRKRMQCVQREAMPSALRGQSLQRRITWPLRGQHGAGRGHRGICGGARHFQRRPCFTGRLGPQRVQRLVQLVVGGNAVGGQISRVGVHTAPGLFPRG